MKSAFKLDDASYNNMLTGINILEATDRPGLVADVTFIDDDFWLQDTAVVENIEKRSGEWHIYLVFAHHITPLKFIKRKIVQYSCYKKALLTAQYMRRQAAKDQRGTLYVDYKAMNITVN